MMVQASQNLLGSSNASKHAYAYIACIALLSSSFCLPSNAAKSQNKDSELIEKRDADSKNSESLNIPEGANKDAWLLLKSAHDSRQVLPPDFAGFNARLTYSVNQKVYVGKIEFRNLKGGTKIDISGLDKDELAWLKDKLISMIGHRRGGDFRKRDGRNPITFSKSDKKNRLGTLVELHDKMNSTYRVRNNKVMEVTRSFGKVIFTISVIQTITADPGKYLANHFLVTYRDKPSNAIKQVDGFRDKYKNFDGVWLPKRRTVISVTPEDYTPEIRKITLSKMEVLRKSVAPQSKK